MAVHRSVVSGFRVVGAGALLGLLSLEAGRVHAVGPWQADTAKATIACAKAALAQGRSLDSVSSLLVMLARSPDPPNKSGRAYTEDVFLGFPDAYKSIARLPLPTGREMLDVRGYSGGRLLARPVDEDVIDTRKPRAESLRAIRHEFARWALVWLLRETAATPLTWSRGVDPDGAFSTVVASGPDDFAMTLVLDKTTCQPVAATWDRPPNFGDMRLGRVPDPKGRHVVRYELSDHRAFQGVRLPTRIRVSIDGVAGSELKVVSVRVNAPLPSDLAGSSRRRTAGSDSRQ